MRLSSGEPPTLDPHLAADTVSGGIIVELFSGLVAFNADLELVADIAEDWDVRDGTVYTFRLRRDVKFHDGKPVTAHDFKWSFERAADPATGSLTAEIVLGDIVGVKDKLEGSAADVSGVEAIDEYTLRITIDAPKVYFLSKLTTPAAYVLNRENVESASWPDQLNGTGPFKLKEFTRGERIILEPNGDYYREPGRLEKVEIILSGASMDMYENGEIDIARVQPSDLKRVLDPNDELSRDLVVAPAELGVSYVGFNSSMPPFDDRKFRQALNHAVDKEQIADEVLSGQAAPAYGILPPGLPGYNPDLEGLGFDLELAQRLLAESDYADPGTRPAITLTVPGAGGPIGLDLQAVIASWQQLGVEVEVQQLAFGDFLRGLYGNEYQAFSLSWGADYPDPHDFLDLLFHSTSNFNSIGYSNPEVDGILEKARVEQDPSLRFEMYANAEKLIVDDAAWLPLWNLRSHVLVKPYVRGYRLTPMITSKLKDVYIEP